MLAPGSAEEVIAKVEKRTKLIDEIERLCNEDDLKSNSVYGYYEDEIEIVEFKDVSCFYVNNNKLYASYKNGKSYLIKMKLWEIEDKLPDSFERISKSAIANWNMIARFSVDFAGAVIVIFKNGHKDYISRRCFQELKRRYKL